MKAYLKSLISKFANQVDYFDLRIEESDSTSISFRGKTIDTLQKNREKGGCVRAIHNGGWGFVSFNSLETADIEKCIQSAVKQAHLVGHDTTRLADVPVIDEVVPLSMIRDPRDIPLEKKVAILKGYNDIILAHSPRITMSSVSYGERYKHTWLATSEGSYLEQESIDIGGGLVPIAVENGQTQMSSVGFGSSNDFSVIMDLESRLVEACDYAVQLLDAPTIKGGTYSVVVDPVLAGVFVHEAFGHTSEGEKVYENKNLAEVMKIGEVFGSPVLSIYDSGLDVGRRGALMFDDEAVRTEKTYLIRNGVLSGRLHSRETAGKMGEAATGNGRALNYKFAPIPRMRNTCIDQGSTPFEDMIKDIKLGVYAVDALGGQGGEMFSFTAGRGYMIRDGNIEEMVKNVTLSGNLFVTLKQIDAVGNDFGIHDSGGGCGKGPQFPMAVSHGSPHIRIRDVVIGGA